LLSRAAAPGKSTALDTKDTNMEISYDTIYKLADAGRALGLDLLIEEPKDPIQLAMCLAMNLEEERRIH